MKREDDIFEEWLHQKRGEATPEALDAFTDNVLNQVATKKRNVTAVWLLRIACILAAAVLGLLRIELLTHFIASAN